MDQLICVDPCLPHFDILLLCSFHSSPEDLSHYIWLMTLQMILAFFQWTNLFLWIHVFHTLIIILLGHTICKTILLVSLGCTFNRNFNLINEMCSLVLLQLTSLLQWLSFKLYPKSFFTLLWNHVGISTMVLWGGFIFKLSMLNITRERCYLMLSLLDHMSISKENVVHRANPLLRWVSINPHFFISTRVDHVF
jgi:hypothetical protein